MKKTSELLVAEWERTGQGADIGDMLDLIDTAEDELKAKRKEMRRLLKIIIDTECECDLNEPCVRCTILNSWYPGASSMHLVPDPELDG